MNFLKCFYSFLTLLVVSTDLSFAQVSSTTATQPTSTTSTNRRQELYDQYHGYNKKSTTTSQTSTPASTPVTPQRQSPTTDYSSSQPTTTRRTQQPVTSQVATSSSSGVRIGVRGGVTNIFFTENQPFLKPRLGFVGGLTFNFGAGMFSFQPEVNYARYGLKVSDDIGLISLKGAVDALEVPLFLKISSGSYDGHRFFVNVGPYAAYLASRSLEGKKIPIDNSENRFDFGGALGIGAALKAGPGHVTIEARGMYSFGDPDIGFNTNNRAINSQLTVGYSFPLGGQ
ncbi:porin family protein [Spirosoma sp.]|uniref:porin family protein n=1 Tax=Spirosoma sp. TaxID=1899569 RepID=UPI003B3A77D8